MKFLLPKMSLHLPVTVWATAVDKDHAVATQVMLVDGPISALIDRRIPTGRTNDITAAS